MKLTFKTLSPVHIATGNKIQPFEYIIFNGHYHRINQNKAFEIIAEDSIDNFEKFDNWLQTSESKLANERDNRKQAQLRDSFNLKNFCDSVLKKPELTEKILSSAVSYMMEIPGGTGGKKEISELQKDGNSQPYIPGSSIKGAIRTALFYAAYKDLKESERTELQNKTLKSKNFYNDKTRKRKGKELDEIIQEEFFHCGVKYNRHGQRNEITYKDLKFDIMKFVTVTDATPVNVKTAVYPCNLYLTKKEHQEQTPALETIDIGSTFEFQIKISVDSLLEAFNVSSTNNSTNWKGLQNKFLKLFEIDLARTSKDDLEEKVIESIIDRIVDFSNWIKLRDLEWLKRYNNFGGRNFNPYKAYPTKSYSIIRVGFGTGFTGMTLYRKADYDHNNGEGSLFFREIIKAFKIGVPKDIVTDDRVFFARAIPSSKRFISLHNNSIPVYNLGWGIILEPGEGYDLNPDLIVDPETIPQQEETSTVTKQYEPKKPEKPKDYKPGDFAEAIFVKAEGKKVFIKLVDEKLSTNELSFSYAAAVRLEEAGKFYVRISVMKNGKVIEVQFGKF